MMFRLIIIHLDMTAYTSDTEGNYAILLYKGAPSSYIREQGGRV